MQLKSEKKCKFTRRKNSDVYLPLLPNHSKSYRLLPRQGEAKSIIEHVSQRIIKFLAWLPIYIAIVVTLTLVILLWSTYK